MTSIGEFCTCGHSKEEHGDAIGICFSGGDGKGQCPCDRFISAEAKSSNPPVAK